MTVQSCRSCCTPETSCRIGPLALSGPPFLCDGILAALRTRWQPTIVGHSDGPRTGEKGFICLDIADSKLCLTFFCLYRMANFNLSSVCRSPGSQYSSTSLPLKFNIISSSWEVLAWSSREVANSWHCNRISYRNTYKHNTDIKSTSSDHINHN